MPAGARAGLSSPTLPDGQFSSLPGTGEPVLDDLDDAVATIACRLRRQHDGGDHTILIGEASAARVRPGEPLVYVDRSFVGVDHPSASTDP